MPTLLLRLAGPMQSWGTESRFDHRDTGTEPSKSGVLGILCAALGIDRSNWEDLEPMTHWRMGVRIDDPGTLRTDYQTAQLQPDNPKSDTAQSWRQYLADARFLVGLESQDRSALEKAHAALRNPHWPLCLGRRAFPPSHPIYIEGGVRNETLEQALHFEANDYALAQESPAETPPTRTLVLEADGEGVSERWDQPIGPFSARRYAPRLIQYVKITLGGQECTSPDSP